MTFYEEDKLPDEIDGMSVIQDITIAIDCLSQNQTIARYEFGDSMKPILESGQFCKLVPISENDEIKQGDCVFACVNGSFGTHLVWMISETENGKYYAIATTQGHIIGWTKTILAKAYGIPHIVKEGLKHPYKKKQTFRHTETSWLSIDSFPSLDTIGIQRGATTIGSNGISAQALGESF